MSAETSWVTCFNPFIDILFWWLVTSVYVKGCSWSAEKNCICGNELFEGAALFCEILCETREILHGNFWVDYQGLWWGCYETYRVLWVVYPVQKGMTISGRWWAFRRTINVDWWLPTLRQWTISFMQINAWLSGNLQKSVASRLVHAMKP